MQNQIKTHYQQAVLSGKKETFMKYGNNIVELGLSENLANRAIQILNAKDL